MVKRLYLFFRRFIHALRQGLLFTGTSRFQAPSSFRLNSQSIFYTTPHEPSNAHDFINLVFDDEYGIQSLAETPRSILDIGANCGLFSLLTRAKFPHATIHAYEPNPRTFYYAQKNFEGTSIKLFQAGIGAESGRAEIIDTSESTLAQTQRQERGSISIVALRDALNAFPEGEIDLLKLDCEGAEWEIFENPTPFEKIKIIRMEYHLIKGKTIRDLSFAIQKIGFKIDRIHENQGFGLVWLSRLQPS